jgi:hypothetical protein
VWTFEFLYFGSRTCYNFSHVCTDGEPEPLKWIILQIEFLFKQFLIYSSDIADQCIARTGIFQTNVIKYAEGNYQWESSENGQDC